MDKEELVVSAPSIALKSEDKHSVLLQRRCAAINDISRMESLMMLSSTNDEHERDVKRKFISLARKNHHSKWCSSYEF